MRLLLPTVQYEKELRPEASLHTAKTYSRGNLCQKGRMKGSKESNRRRSAVRLEGKGRWSDSTYTRVWCLHWSTTAKIQQLCACVTSLCWSQQAADFNRIWITITVPQRENSRKGIWKLPLIHTHQSPTHTHTYICFVPLVLQLKFPSEFLHRKAPSSSSSRPLWFSPLFFCLALYSSIHRSHTILNSQYL